MNNPQISIITTVKNGEEFIDETLYSVFNQTYKNYEHIIVDDGSTDGTVKKIQTFQEENTSYKLHLYQPGHLGRGKALNYAIAKAQADWVAIIDADDLWHPQKLEMQLQCIRKHKDITVLGTKTKLFTETSEIGYELLGENQIKVISKKELLLQSRLSHSSVIIKKEYCSYNEKRNSQLDYDLWLRLMDKKEVQAILNMQLCYHRVHKNQSFESKQGKEYRLKGFKLVFPYLIDNNAYGILLKKIFKLIVSYILPMSVIRKARKM